MSDESVLNVKQFDDVVPIIEGTRLQAMQAANAEMIQMCWEIVAYSLFSRQIKAA